MAAPFAATSQWQAMSMNFYAHHQTINYLVITSPTALAAGNFTPHSFITRLHKIYAFIIPALLAMLQIHGAGNSTSPFQVHSWASVFGVLGYYLAFIAWLRLPQYAAKLSIAMAAFGSFSLACLVTLLLPHSWWHFKYIFYVLLAVVELHQLLIVLYDKYLRIFILTMRRSWWPNGSARHLLPRTRMDLRDHNNV